MSITDGKREKEKLKMKAKCITFFIVAIIILLGVGIGLPKNAEHTEYLRIHIRAESNSQSDQAIKYKVKDAVVEYLTPFIAECDTFEKAKSLISIRLNDIEKVADKVLKSAGFNYKSKASVKKEEFPTRFYGQLELKKGFYNALIIELGSAKGDNWWCVVYPPLCFTDGTIGGYVYKSKISAIIEDFFNKEKKGK